MQQFKFISIFSSILKPLVSEEKDKYLALASLIDIGAFIPSVDTGKNIDLLPVAFNACVVNRANKNGDVIDTQTALEAYKHFINKPINVEHNRQQVVGTILTAGFSEFGTDKVLSEEQVRDTKTPFNITLGGIIWKVVNSTLADVIENSNDPTSEDYLKVSASWELGFSGYHIIVTEGEEKNIENGLIIENEEEISKLQGSLKGLGGSGKLENGKNVYRKVIAQVVPLGVGLTVNPAADVKGVAVLTIKAEVVEEKIAPVKEKENDKLNKTKNNSSLSTGIHVLTLKEDMKISSVADITDALLLEVKASSMVEFIESEIKRASEQFTAEKTSVEVALKAATDKTEAVSKDYETLKEEFSSVKKALDEIEKARASKDAEEAFNQRMSALEEEFQFDDELRAEVAKEIKDLNEESFSAYHGKMKKMAKGLTKKQEKLPDFIKDKIKDKEEKEDGKKEMKSSVETVTEVVEKAVEVKEMVIASTTPADMSVASKYKSAFSIENFNIKY